MLPGLLQTRLRELPGQRSFRLAVAIALVIFHLAAFTRAAHVRLGLPFNAAPGQAPYYSDPDAMSLANPPRQPHHWSRLVVSRWDAQHYIGFAIRGLTSCPKDGATAKDWQYMQCGLAWVPTYGEVGRFIADTTGIPADYVLLLMSILIAIAINMMWTCKTITSRLGLAEAYGALFAFNLFVSGFYIVTPYPEGATFACMLGAFILIANQRWLPAALLVGLSTALRPTSVAYAFGFGCAALYATWQGKKANTKQWWKPLATTPLAIWGQLALMLALKIYAGDPKAYLRGQKAFAGNRGNFHPFQIFDPKFYLHSFSGQHLDGVMLIGVFALIALGSYEVVKRFKRDEAVFLVVASACVILMPLVMLNGYWGLNRYLLLCALTYFSAGAIVRRLPVVYVLWLALSFSFYWNIEMCSYVAQGDPRVCNCFGKMEFTMPFES
jgi:hypothetical protein